MNIKLFFAAFFLAIGFTFFSAQENYKTLVFKGNQKFDKENYESSSSKYMEAIQLNDKEFMAHFNLGNSLYKRKMFDEAKAEFEKAEKRSTNLPDKSAALYNLGNTYMQQQDSKKAAELYKQALKQDPYNESIRKNYEIAMLKEKEKEEQKKQKDNSGGGNGDEQNKEKDKGQDKGDQPQKEAGSGEQNKGKGDGDDPNKNKNNNPNELPKDLQNAILDRVGNKERETAKRILNKNSYSMPESNEKDW